jgi:hypothetical protein
MTRASIDKESIVSGICGAIMGPGRQDFLLKTNRVLLEKGMIATPLSVEEIYGITEIWGSLLAELKKAEENLIARREPNGSRIVSAWKAI